MTLPGTSLRVSVTLIVVAIAALIGWRLWTYYTLAPWTRDARVLASVVEITPDVSGLVSAVNVADNQQVKRGDILFVIDQKRFNVAVQQAQATVDSKAQTVRLAQDTANRNTTIARSDSDAISVEAVESTSVSAAVAQAELEAARAVLASRQLDLERSTVRAPADGYITNLRVNVGDYATAGRGVMALVDSQSFYVYAYFMETKLPAIRDGSPARVELMAGDVVLDGVVEGLSRAIANTGSGGGLLANVAPNFEWIRLAQRIPVRIKLGKIPPDVRLVAGMSATVVVQPNK